METMPPRYLRILFTDFDGYLLVQVYSMVRLPGVIECKVPQNEYDGLLYTQFRIYNSNDDTSYNNDN